MPGAVVSIGGDHWLARKYADDIELHAFADKRSGNQVPCLNWLQFEGYQPSHPEYHHTCGSKRQVTPGDMNFLVDTWVNQTAATGDRDSDAAHLKALVHTKGYVLPESLMPVRFVRAMDGGRKEQMFFYSEDIAPRGSSAADPGPGGKGHEQWPELEFAVIARGLGSAKFY